MIQSILNTRSWAMVPEVLEQFLARIANIDHSESSLNGELKAIYQEDFDPKKATYEKKNGIATIFIHGPLLKRSGGFFAWLLGIGSYQQIGKAYQQAMVDPDVKGLFLDCDSPGGSVDGCSDLADIIYQSRGKKPSIAFCDGTATSAACWIATSAKHTILANEGTMTGSIGVFGVHFDVSAMAEKEGIKPTIFSAGKYKSVGNKYEPLSDSDKKIIQEPLDKHHDIFVKAIARNIGVPVENLNADLRESKIYLGSEAVKVKLAQEILSRKQAVEKLKGLIGSKYNGGSPAAKVQNSTIKGKNNMEYKNIDLVSIVSAINAIDDIDVLAKLESGLTAEFSCRLIASPNWVETEKIDSLKKHTKMMIGNRRLHILSKPAFLKERDEYNLGKAIAKGK